MNVLYLCSPIWTYLEHITDLLNGTVSALKCIKDDTEIAKVNISLTIDFHKLSVYNDDTEYKVIARTTAINIPHVTNQNGEVLPGLLIYIMEGVLPLLKVFLGACKVQHVNCITFRQFLSIIKL